ncbi:MAG: hypothetical protein ACKVQA_22960 [Burkholderiales bacterium]
MNAFTLARLVCAFCFAVISFLAVAQTDAPAASSPEAQAKRPPRAGRVYIKDVEGIWMAQQYMNALKATRSPRAAARKSQPIVIQLKKENGIYPILTTNFRSAVLEFMIEIEPDKKPQSWRFVTSKSEGIVSSSDVIYSYFTGKRAMTGTFETLSLKEPHFAKRKSTQFARLGEPLEVFVNKNTVAGKYKDEEGKPYEFSSGGEATFPDRKFVYEVLLDTTQANCDVLTSHHEKEPEGKERIGFAAKGEKLYLYKAQSPSKNVWSCEPKPFATLTRGEQT